MNRAVSIRKKLFGLLGVAFVMTVVTTIATVYIQAKSETDEIFNEQLKQIANIVKSSKSITYDEGAYNEKIEGLTVVIFDSSHAQIYASHPVEIPYPKKDGISKVTLHDERHIIYSTKDNAGTVVVMQEQKLRDEIALESALASCVSITIFFFIFGILLAIMINKALNPLRVFEQKVSQIDEDSLQSIDFGELPKELVPLGESLNSMITRINSSIESKKIFINDAAHELRTPLAALRLQLEVAMSQKGDMKESLKKIERGILRSERVVNQLLSLAREDENRGDIEIGNVDISSIVVNSIVELHQLAESKNIELKADIPSGINAKVEPFAFATIVNNLIDNAIRYTPNDGEIDITLKQGQKSVEFIVADSGIGIVEKNRVFDRFYRANNKSIGSGLGLAIVKEIATRYNLSISIEDNTPKGTIFTVKIPKMIS